MTEIEASCRTTISTEKDHQSISSNNAFDDVTNSSILDFLNQEQKCLVDDFNNSSDLDVESLFEEINRLSDNTDQRSVDEILREAEILMQSSNYDYKLNGNLPTNNLKFIEEKTLTPCAIRKNGESAKSDIPTTIIQEKLSKNPTSKNTTFNENECVKRLSDPLAEQTEHTNSLKKLTCNDLSKRKSLEVNKVDISSSRQTHVKYGSKTSPHTPPKSRFVVIGQQEKEQPDNPSQITFNMTTSFNESWSRERTLEKQIEDLSEKLKDTEERFQSLRIQHDSLAQQHRCLNETSTQFQDETEKLKLDVQHLSECANILRIELQSARADRTEAQELQKSLEAELIDSRGEKKRFADEADKNAKMVQDLQRQCREMERILMRKHPDSVSALIVASKNSSSNSKDDNSSSRRLLEQRITQLETDAKEQDEKARKILANVQAKFSTVQSKYETHIADLETQVLSLQEINSKLNEKLTSRIEEIERYRNRVPSEACSTQTDDVAEKETTMTRSVGQQTVETKKILGCTGSSKKGAVNKLTNSFSETTIHQVNTSAKEDAHLMATLRGMRVDLAIKEKAMQRLTRELDDCKKTIKKLQKERDTYLKGSISDKSGSSALTGKKNYDPSQFSETSSSSRLLQSDSSVLKEALNKIKLLEFDYKSLHEKRLQDLKTLQAAHEREMSSCKETVRILQQRLTERDEAIATQKRRRVPIDYYALKAKVSSLERRHSEREERLHMLVDALSKGRLNGELENSLSN